MCEKQLPDHPDFEQYRKQAKELARECALRIPDALARLKKNHPRLHNLTEAELCAATIRNRSADWVRGRG